MGWPWLRVGGTDCANGCSELEGVVGYCVLPEISEVSSNVYFLVPSVSSIVVTGSFLFSLLFTVNYYYLNP